MGWVLQSEDRWMPDWLKETMKAECEYCGTEKENYYNEEGECTNRRCPNPQCIGTIGRKFGAMTELLQWKGISDKTGMKLAREHNLTTHLQIVPYVTNEKPSIRLCDLFRICFIPGVDTAWEGVCSGHSSVQSVIDSHNNKYHDLIVEYQDTLYEAESYFNIIQPTAFEYDAVITGNVMLHGHINEYENRDDFIHHINYAYKGLVRLRVVGKRKTDVMCLVQEDLNDITGKAEVALANGIPIKTSKEFVEYIDKLLRKKMGMEKEE